MNNFNLSVIIISIFMLIYLFLFSSISKDFSNQYRDDSIRKAFGEYCLMKEALDESSDFIRECKSEMNINDSSYRKNMEVCKMTAYSINSVDFYNTEYGIKVSMAYIDKYHSKKSKSSMLLSNGKILAKCYGE